MVLDQFVHPGRDADLARLRDMLDLVSDIDAVADQVLAVDQDIAEIDPDPEPHAAVLGHVRAHGFNSLLDVRGATQRFDRAGEFGHDAVARASEDPALMVCHQRLDRLPARPQGAVGAILVRAHHATKFRDIGGKDGRQFAYRLVVAHRVSQHTHSTLDRVH